MTPTYATDFMIPFSTLLRRNTQIHSTQTRGRSNPQQPNTNTPSPPPPTHKRHPSRVKPAIGSRISKPSSNARLPFRGKQEPPPQDDTKHPSLAKPVIGSRISKPSSNARLPFRGKQAPPPPEPPIRVFVNNRLGSRAEILCCPSDTIGDFKKLVSMRLGVPAGAIMLKRQGQRSMRDSLTLRDYEVGSGSSLDLELDMGD